jgi:hypothetical protein
MTEKQLGTLYAVLAVMFVVSAILIDQAINKPMDAQAYADRLCRELYGPQTGATWEKGALMCESAKGEIIEVRRIK